MKILITLFIILGIILLLTIIYIIVGIYFFHFAEDPKFSKKKLFKRKPATILSTDESREWFNKIYAEDVFIKNKRNPQLHAYLIKRKKSSKWVIIAHGYTNEGLEMLTPANHFYDNGYNILLLDLRAHGKSKGKYSTMGWKERLDIIDWIDYIIKSDSKSQIVLYGVSMGATSVMMTVGEKLPHNVVAAIEDCGFVSAYQQFYHQLSYLKFRPRHIIWIANVISKIKRNFDVYHSSDIKQLKKGKIPMLFIHGSKDKLVPLECTIEAYEIYPGKKDILIMEGAKHMNSSIIDPEQYWNKIDSFLSDK